MLVNGIVFPIDRPIEILSQVSCQLVCEAFFQKLIIKTGHTFICARKVNSKIAEADSVIKKSEHFMLSSLGAL